MDFITAVKTCMRKYVDFSGRARRSEYWWFYLFTFIIGILAAVIDGIMIGFENADQGPVGIVSSLVFLLPSLSVTWRRLHDTGRSGWWVGGVIIAAIVVVLLATGVSSIGSGAGMVGLFIILAIGLVGWGITLFVFMCLDSHREENKYGPSPKYGPQNSVFD